MIDTFKIGMAWVARIGAVASDPPRLRVQKSLLALASVPLSLAAVLWGALYIFSGAWQAGMIPLIYGFVVLALLFVFGVSHHYPSFRVSQLLGMLLLPGILMHTLGGFVLGSAVTSWSILSPLSALLLDSPRRSIWWFGGFGILVTVSGMLEPHVMVGSPLDAGTRTVFFVLNLLVPASVIFGMVFYFVSERDRFQQRSEDLLLNILPAPIVELLREQEQTIAQDFDHVSIMFADVVGFTSISANMAPTQLVHMLDEVFLYFDQLAERYGVEKIKTIGDCYMAACGVPSPRADHASALVQLALEAQSHAAAHRFGGMPLTFRIGINSGAVVAGVIGRKKFSYDLWGDAVNTASRMESHGIQGTVQISRATYELVKDEFECAYLGTIPVKGKGEMDVWSVTGRKPLVT